MIIDFEHHLYVKEHLHEGVSESGKICERYWDRDGQMKTRLFEEASRVDSHLKFMDEASIDVAVLTTNPERDLQQCRSWNDYCAWVVHENPNRFVGFASVPPLGGEAAFGELERAINELGLKGVHIFTCADGRFLDSRELWPFYEKVSELRIPIDVHISGYPQGYDALHAPYALHYLIAREIDMCAATLRICLGGVLEDFPNLVFIMNHFGGGVSSLVERIDVYMNYVGPGCPSLYRDRPLISKPWREYFDKLYFNMAGREVGIAAVKCALANISPRKLMFGTDWPWNYEDNACDVRRYVAEIRKLDLVKEEIDAMLGGNAAKLLGIEQGNTSPY